MTRALVLAGGGLAGIAWETGILMGISDEIPAAADALTGSDVLLGTSAGAAVGAQLGSGRSLADLFAAQLAPDSHELDPGVSTADIGALFVEAFRTLGSKTAKLQRMAQIALAADTVPEPVRRDVIARRLPSHHWPARELRITAVDAETGELVVFTAASGVGLVDAVAASCAVPGAWPPVTIGARRYVDGGVNSSVNMAVVADCAQAVVLVPAPVDAPSPWPVDPAGEVAAFPGPALAVFADADTVAAFGPNPLDPACRAPAAAAGRRQGRKVAAEIAEFLGV